MSLEKDLNRDDVEVEIVQQHRLFCSYRLILAIVGFFMFFHLYAQRIGMSVAIVCMVNQTALSQKAAILEGTLLNQNLTSIQIISLQINNSSPLSSQSHLNETILLGFNKSDQAKKFMDSGEINSVRTPQEQCSLDFSNSNKTLIDGPFEWEKSLQGHILGSFFYGYLISQIPGGLLAEQFGGKWVLVVSLGLSTLATLFTPIAARIHVGLLIVVRVICGIGSGTLYPAMHAMWGQWSPPLERSTLCGLTYAGAMMGNVIALPVSGLLCQYGFSEGWDSIFYIIGISSTLCIILWTLISSNTPNIHPTISLAEKNYILKSLKQSGASQAKTDLCNMPWKKIFTSGPVWALIIANFVTDWGLYTFLTNIPTFYREVLFFDIQSNGFFSALPFLGLFVIMNIVPTIADSLLARRYFSVVNVRKIFNTIGLVGPAILLILLSFIDCTQTALAVVLLVLAVSVSGFVFSGYLVNHMDIAPQFAGTLMGIANGIAAISGFVAPFVAATITKDQSRESWQIVFFIAAGVYVAGSIAYCLLASGDIQPWARDQGLKEIDLEVSNESEKSERKIFATNGDIYKPRNGGGDSNLPMLIKHSSHNDRV